MVSSTWPLVGRETELQVLAEAMDDPTAGGVVLLGAAGVGKTRLAQSAIEMAEARGLATVSVRASRSASHIPFAALAPLFAELHLPSEVNAGLLRQAGEAVHQRRGEGRLVLAVDDAQELDDASGALLEHLLRTGDVMVILTARLGERQVAAVHDMWKDERIVRLEVHPLDDNQVRSLVSMALGAPVEGSLLQTLVDSCVGNVLFLRELINGALESDALGQHQGMWRLTGSIARSPRLHDLIEQRLSGISAQEREVLELVALGEPLEVAFLATVVASDCVELLERRGILESEPGEPSPLVRFDHPLFGEVVREHLSPMRRVHLSRQLADAAETAGITDMRAAVWRLDGGGAIRSETAMPAAREAFIGEDYVLAARLARSVWEADGSLSAALLVADSYDLSGRYDDIDQLLVAAYPRAADDAERTEVAVRRASTLFRLPAQSHRADGVLAEAMARTVDPACRRKLLSQQANLLLLTGDVARAIELIGGVLGEGGESPVALASRDFGVALTLAGRTGDALRHTSEGLAACLSMEEEGELTAAAVFVVAQALALCESGALAEAAAMASGAYDITVERQNVDGQAWFAAILGWIRCAEGRLVSAGHLFQESASCFERLGHPGQRWGLGGMALAAGQMGDAVGCRRRPGPARRPPPHHHDHDGRRGHAGTGLGGGGSREPQPGPGGVGWCGGPGRVVGTVDRLRRRPPRPAAAGRWPRRGPSAGGVGRPGGRRPDGGPDHVGRGRPVPECRNGLAGHRSVRGHRGPPPGRRVSRPGAGPGHRGRPVPEGGSRHGPDRGPGGAVREPPHPGAGHQLGAGPADRAGAGGGRPGRHRGLESGDRRSAVRLPPHRRQPPAAHLHQAGPVQPA